MKPRRLFDRITQGQINNVGFSELTRLAEDLGFKLRRIEGSHRIYKHPGISEMLNLQPLKSGDAKSYQVRQLARLIREYSLRVED